jgi:hypothetical protein
MARLNPAKGGITLGIYNPFVRKDLELQQNWLVFTRLGEESHPFRHSTAAHNEVLTIITIVGVP